MTTAMIVAWVDVSSISNLTHRTAITPLTTTPPQKKLPPVMNEAALEHSMPNITGFVRYHATTGNHRG